jgi:general secretion pathway protein G
MKPKAPQGGFTLLEIMVVVVIIGILAALVVPNIIGRPDEARQIAAKQDVASLMQALKLYRLDNLRYPSSEQGLQALVTKPTTGVIPPNWKPGGYVQRLPRDPWGNPYQYLNPGVQGEIDVFSYGADGAAGGEGIDADIGSWNL